MHPYNHKMGQKIQTSVPGVTCDRGFVAHFQVAAANAVAASDTGILAATAMPGSGTTVVTEGITNPAVPRALKIKGNAAGITGNVVIAGTNYADEALTETIALNGATAVDGVKAFKTVTSITIPPRNAEGNTVSVGYNDKLGLPYKLAHNTVLIASLDNSREATAPTVTVSQTAIESNTVDLNSALNGKQVDVYLIA